IWKKSKAWSVDVGKQQQRRRPRPLALLLHSRHRRGRDQEGLRARRKRRDGIEPEVGSGTSRRTAGDDLSCRRAQSSADGLQSPEAAAGDGQGRRRVGSVRLTVSNEARRRFAGGLFYALRRAIDAPRGFPETFRLELACSPAG